MAEGFYVNIIGAGLAGLSAAKTLAAAGARVRLFSAQASERAQSNLAEGGINAALNVMGEADSPQEHFADTMRGGCDLADPNMVRDLTQAAPEVVRELAALGVPFHHENGKPVQRSFGGQKKKRTSYARSSTGKVLTIALIDAVRRYEAQGLVERYPHHRFERLLLESTGKRDARSDGGEKDRASKEDGKRSERSLQNVSGVQVRDTYSNGVQTFSGPVLMACGGLNGLLPGATTGTTANTGSAAAALFAQGVAFGNLEFLQYHPTTVAIAGKRLLISEAARGEGGRLFCYEDGGRDARCYFMEEKFGPRGNLMPRDVISREMAHLGRQAYLDLTGLSKETWERKLPDLREEVQHYLGVDPAQEPVPVSPGIHFFMGGILTDAQHRTSLPHLYAAGECACAYHGANRLGGNSLLGAVYGGKRAARTILQEEKRQGQGENTTEKDFPEGAAADRKAKSMPDTLPAAPWSPLRPDEEEPAARMGAFLLAGLPVLRSEQTIKTAEEQIRGLNPDNASGEQTCVPDALSVSGEQAHSLDAANASDEWNARKLLSLAMLESALARRESRGAHTRTDCPDTLDAYRKTTRAQLVDGQIQISFEEIPKLRA